MGKKQSPIILDIECYPNYFLVMMVQISTGKIRSFELDENNELDIGLLRQILNECPTIGFNSRMYDIPMIRYAFTDKNNKELKTLSDRLISKEEKTYDVLCELDLWCPSRYDHIDIMNVAGGIKTSLKVYGGRMEAINLQELPYDPNIDLTKEQKIKIKEYCENDLNLTMSLYKKLAPQLAIRELINKEYKVDVRSKSDAQITEVLIKKSLSQIGNIPDIYKFKYHSPEYIKFQSNELQELQSKIATIEFKVKKGEKLDKSLIQKNVEINGSQYGLGVGGIHSKEKRRAIIPSDEEYIIDLDVASYYPSLILNNEYVPNQFDKKEFLEVYGKIKQSRIKAKLSGDKVKADIYKIILNGTFGKFGDQHSELYSPELLVHTTITGQLTLLLMIEKLENYGFRVISANTDGVISILKKKDYGSFQKLVQHFEKLTNLSLEETRCKGLYNESVNSYIAVKEDGSLKCKGTYAENSLSKNPAIKVCKDAVINYITKSTPIEDTIYQAEPKAENFGMMKKVQTKCGASWKGKSIGKLVHWYWSTTGSPILRIADKKEIKKDGALKKDVKVSESDDAYPIMNLSEGLKNIHYDKYIEKAYKMLSDIGVEVKRPSKEKVAA